MPFMSFILPFSPLLPPAYDAATLCSCSCHIPIIVASTQHIYLSFNHPTPTTHFPILAIPYTKHETYIEHRARESLSQLLSLSFSSELSCCKLCRKNPLAQTYNVCLSGWVSICMYIYFCVFCGLCLFPISTPLTRSL